MKMSADFNEAMPSVNSDRSPDGMEPDYVIQRYSPEARIWRDWDCAYTRAEADHLLAAYERRYRALGLDWRIARVVYEPPRKSQPESEHSEELPATA
jgi:hypothetical protein